MRAPNSSFRLGRGAYVSPFRYLDLVDLNGATFVQQPRVGALLYVAIIPDPFVSVLSGCRASLQHLPVLLVTDLMCRLGPSLKKKVPDVFTGEGALPRDADGNVDIPSLATEGIHVGVGEDAPGNPEVQAECTQENVYNLLRDAGLKPRVQRGTDFRVLLDLYAMHGGMGIYGEGFVSLARTLLRSLRRRSRYSVDLVEVVAVLHARVTVIILWLETENLELHGSALEQLRAYRDFSAHVLRIAGGFGIDDVPALPSFYEQLPPPRVEEFVTQYYVPEMDREYVDVRGEDGAMDAVMLEYSMVSVTSLRP